MQAYASNLSCTRAQRVLTAPVPSRPVGARSAGGRKSNKCVIKNDRLVIFVLFMVRSKASLWMPGSSHPTMSSFHPFLHPFPFPFSLHLFLLEDKRPPLGPIEKDDIVGWLLLGIHGEAFDRTKAGNGATLSQRQGTV